MPKIKYSFDDMWSAYCLITNLHSCRYLLGIYMYFMGSNNMSSSKRYKLHDRCEYPLQGRKHVESILKLVIAAIGIYDIYAYLLNVFKNIFSHASHMAYQNVITLCKGISNLLRIWCYIFIEINKTRSTPSDSHINEVLGTLQIWLRYFRCQCGTWPFISRNCRHCPKWGLFFIVVAGSTR